MKLDQRREECVVRMVDPHDRRHRETRLQVGQPRRPGGRNFVGDHDQRAAGVLRLVPGVEQLFLVALSASSNSRPPTRSTKLRASSVRPDRRGPVRIVALTGHMLHLRK